MWGARAQVLVKFSGMCPLPPLFYTEGVDLLAHRPGPARLWTVKDI